MADYKMEAVKTFTYERPEIKNGYTDHTLYVNLTDETIAVKPVAEKTKQTFIGGRG